MQNTLNFSVRNTFQLLFLIIISVYLIFSPSLNQLAFDDKRIAELILISFVLLSALLNFDQSNNQPFFKLALNKQIALISILLLLVLSSISAPDQISAFLEASLYLGLFFFCFSIGKIAKEQSRVISLFFFITFSVSALLYQTSFFSSFLASFIENIPLQWPEPFSGFSNVRFFNQYQIWTITLLPLPILLYPKLDKRLLSFLKIIAIGWAILLFASGGRGAFASIIFALLLTFAVFKDQGKPLIKLNALILVAGGVGYLLLFKLIPFVLENKVTMGWKTIEELSHSSGRIVLWQTAVQYIIDKPWLGIGPMHYAYYPGQTNAHPHNSVLQWASETGIPSTLLVIFLVISSLKAWVKKFYRLKEDNKLYVSADLWIALFCSICSGLIYSTVSGVIVMPLSQIMMALIAGWMIGIYFQDHEIKPVSRKQKLSVRLLAGLTLITLTYTVLPSLMPRLTSYSDLPFQDYPVTTPRFWQIGGIPH